MHSNIGQHDEHSGEYCKSNHVAPQRTNIDTKGTQDRCSRHFDVETVLVVDEGEIGDLIHAQSFKSIMEDGQLQIVSTIGLAIFMICGTHGLKP